MLEHQPVRRDPRLLLLVEEHHEITFAALDAWEVRGVGVIASESAGTMRFAVATTILQVKPTVIVTSSKSRVLRSITRELADRHGITVVRLDDAETAILAERLPSPEALTAIYRELRGVDDGRALAVVQLAAAALAHLTIPTRLYVPSRKSSSPSALVAARCPRCDRSTRLPHRTPGRRVRPPGSLGGRGGARRARPGGSPRRADANPRRARP